MDKTHTVVAAIISMNCVEKPQDFNIILIRLIKNDLFELIGEKGSIISTDEEKPHLKTLLSELAFLQGHKLIEPRHTKTILEAAWKKDWWEWDISWYLLDSKLLEEVQGNLLDGIIEEVIKELPKAWSDFIGGKEKALSSFIGPIMKKAGGKANPNEIKDLLKRRALK